MGMQGTHHVLFMHYKIIERVYFYKEEAEDILLHFSSLDDTLMYVPIALRSSAFKLIKGNMKAIFA